MSRTKYGPYTLEELRHWRNWDYLSDSGIAKAPHGRFALVPADTFAALLSAAARAEAAQHEEPRLSPHGDLSAIRAGRCPECGDTLTDASYRLAIAGPQPYWFRCKRGHTGGGEIPRP